MRPTFAYADTTPEPVPIVQQYCSCVTYLKNFLPNAPMVDALFFQTFPRTTPSVGTIAMFSYGDGVLKQHVAYVSYIDKDGFYIHEANKVPCAATSRFIRWDDTDTGLVGFFKP